MNYASLFTSHHVFSRQDYDLIYSMDALAAQGLRPWENLDDWQLIRPDLHPELWEEGRLNTYNIQGRQLEGRLDVPYTDAWSVSAKRRLARFDVGVHHTRRAWYDSYEDTDLTHVDQFTLSSFPGKWRAYQATVVTVEKPADDGPLALSASYTRSKSRGYSGWGQLSFYRDSQYHIFNHENGRLGDVPNQVQASASYVFPFGITVGMNSWWADGATWTPLIYVRDTLPGHHFDDRWRSANYEPEGSRRYEPFTNTDLRLSYRFPKMRGVSTALEVDVFNLFNQQREIAVDRGVGFGHYDTDAEPGSQAWLDYVHTHAPVLDVPRAAFGKVTAYSTPRRFMLNAVLRF